MKLDFAAERVLAVVAHPDDVELLCAGTLARTRADNAAVAMCTMCRGNRGVTAGESANERSFGVSEMRQAEFTAAAQLLGAEVFFGGIGDGELEDTPDQRRVLVSILRRFRPTLVLTHSPNDYHADHRAASKLAEAASWFACSAGHITGEPPLERPPAVWLMDTVEMHGFSPGFYVDVSAHIQLKRDMLACHKSQLDRAGRFRFHPPGTTHASSGPDARPAGRYRGCRGISDPFRVETRSGLVVPGRLLTSSLRGSLREVPIMQNESEPRTKWYEGVTSYMWLVLLIGSLGWIFDVFEGQIFVASMNEAMPSLVPEGTGRGAIDFYNNCAMAAFLVGGALGGVLFGKLSDRIGRTTTMILTILMYSLFTFVTAFARTPFEMIGLRFLVAMGTGGEWAVASAMIAEVFPRRARAWSLGIFHGSSVLGTYLAALAGLFIPMIGWRWGFAIGAFPALMTLWIRWKLKEPEQWVQARDLAKEDSTKQTGRIRDLFASGLLRNTLVGLTLATIGLATFWGVHIYGRELLRTSVKQSYLAELDAEKDRTETESLNLLSDSARQSIKNWEMLGMILVTTGGGIGLLSFGPICERIGRRATFLFFHVGGLVTALIVFQGMPDASPNALAWMLPLFGYMTLGMHAGYAIYFPELFPTRLRGTGGGFCFNGGRFLAASILLVRGWMRSEDGLGLSLESTATALSLLFLVGIFTLLFAPETKGQELPE